jgi:FKBP-type peptidyl-prolyl cis-trans isomerase SlpA
VSTREGTGIQPGSRVRMHLEIKLGDGICALSTFGEEPLEITLGDGTLADGLERLLLGLGPDASERFLVDGAELYGKRANEKIQWMERTAFPAGLEPSPGQVVAFDTPGGQEIAGIVLSANPDLVQVDFNHPLSGRSLQIRVKILSVSAPPAAGRNP